MSHDHTWERMVHNQNISSIQTIPDLVFPNFDLQYCRRRRWGARSEQQENQEDMRSHGLEPRSHKDESDLRILELRSTLESHSTPGTSVCCS